MAGLTTLVAGLGKLVSGQVAVLGNVASLTARVTLDRAGLAVLGKVVRTATLVTGGGLTLVSARSSWSWSRLSLWALSGDVAKLGTSVTLGALSSVRAVTLNVTNVTARVTLLGSGGLWFRTSTGLVTRLAAVVAQSLLLLAVVGDVAGFTAFVTSSWEHF